MKCVLLNQFTAIKFRNNISYGQKCFQAPDFHPPPLAARQSYGFIIKLKCFLHSIWFAISGTPQSIQSLPQQANTIRVYVYKYFPSSSLARVQSYSYRNLDTESTVYPSVNAIPFYSSQSISLLMVKALHL